VTLGHNCKGRREPAVAHAALRITRGDAVGGDGVGKEGGEHKVEHREEEGAVK
jgi:hypothetical protein